MIIRKLLIITVSLFIYGLTIACDCSPQKIDTVIQKSEIIIIGKVIKQESSWFKSFMTNFGIPLDTACYYNDEGKKSRYTEIHYCNEIMVYHIAIEKFYKGETTKDTLSVYTYMNSNCRNFLSLNTDYLFCINYNNQNDLFGLSLFSEISSCSTIIPMKINPDDEYSLFKKEQLDYIENKFKL